MEPSKTGGSWWRVDKTWSTGDWNDKTLQYSCLENLMTSMKRQKDKTLKDELHWLVDVQYATGEEPRTGSIRNEEDMMPSCGCVLW